MSWDGINRRGPRACHGRLRPLLCTLGLLAPIVWVAPIVGLAGPPGPAPAYTPHAPIQIFSNGDFTAANGVVRGSGTAGDPYMIEGWEIAAASSGIAIRDTDKFFVIRNVYIHGSPMGYSWVWLGFLSNGRVEDSLFTDNWAAAFGNYVTNVTFARNNATRNVEGFGVAYSRNVSFLFSTASSADAAGISFGASTEVLVAGNLLVGNQWGVHALSESEGIVRNNEVRANTGVGVRLYQQSLGGSVAVYGNRIVGNAVQAEDDGGPNNRWDDGYPRGGNYWSDYAGVDDCSGPLQDVCPDPDGIGDTPYGIDADSRDGYPLVAPPGPIEDPPAPPEIASADLDGPGLVDVRVEWHPSADDGAGERDVVAYEIWSGTAYDPTGASYALVATVPAGTTSYSAGGQGVGDPADRFYVVRAVDVGGTTSNASGQAAKVARFLGAGDHLLSLPLAASDSSTAAVLRTIPWTRVRTYDAASQAWPSSIAGKPWNALATLDRTEGFWVNVSADAWWVVAGLVPAATDVPLWAGWNLIGYPSFVDRTVAQALAGAPYDAVEGYAPVAPYYLRRMAPGDGMAAGAGYWVHATADATVTIAN